MVSGAPGQALPLLLRIPGNGCYREADFGRCATKKAPPMAGQEGRKEESHATFTMNNLPHKEATKCDLVHSDFDYLRPVTAAPGKT
jgi:hypothetical protein